MQITRLCTWIFCCCTLFIPASGVRKIWNRKPQKIRPVHDFKVNIIVAIGFRLTHGFRVKNSLSEHNKCAN